MIIAVSVDVYANARRYLRQDDREWRLVPECRWAIGRRADLAAVGTNYRFGVEATSWRINGTVTYRIDRTEAACSTRPDTDAPCSHGRSTPRDVEHVLRQLG